MDLLIILKHSHTWKLGKCDTVTSYYTQGPLKFSLPPLPSLWILTTDSAAVSNKAVSLDTCLLPHISTSMAAESFSFMFSVTGAHQSRLWSKNRPLVHSLLWRLLIHSVTLCIPGQLKQLESSNPPLVLNSGSCPQYFPVDFYYRLRCKCHCSNHGFPWPSKFSVLNL